MTESDPMKFSTYKLDEEYYFICDGEVYTNDETGDRVKVDMLPSSLQMYGTCLDAALFELKITKITEIDNNQALISAEDGAGIDFVFVEPDYLKNKELYKIGQKGIYEIKAELESVVVPEDCEDGVTLEGEDAKKFFDWVGDKVEDNAVACVPFAGMAVYSPCKDFEHTGRYNFYGTATHIRCWSISEEIDEADPEKTAGFTIPLMNQFNKEEPRFAEACFEYPEYYKGEIMHGWAVKAVLRFIGLHGTTNNIYEYGKNRTVCPEEKGLFYHDADEYIEDENGNRWLKELDDEIDDDGIRCIEVNEIDDEED